MKDLATTFGCFVCLAAMTAVADAQDEIVFAELGGVQLVSKPVDLGRDDYLATIVELRANDPNAAFVTFENISITGEVAQLHGNLTSAFLRSGNAFKEKEGALYGIGWCAIDTHLLIQEAMIEGGDWHITETNDGSYGDGGFYTHALGTAKAGIGPIHFASPTDAFFLLPEFHQGAIDFAYIVTPVDKATAGTDVRMTLGLLGSGIVNAGEEGGAAFGYDGNPDVVVPFAVPVPSGGLIALVGSVGWIALHRSKVLGR